ncbi:hypothetical protein HK405_012147 [Cladochytrium tenue]|nr:hypothetical protein HK405_012147 [Cladochytrium tenue]
MRPITLVAILALATLTLVATAHARGAASYDNERFDRRALRFDYDSLQNLLEQFVDGTRMAAASHSMVGGKAITWEQLDDDGFRESLAAEISSRAVDLAFPKEADRARLVAAFDIPEFRDAVDANLAAAFGEIFGGAFDDLSGDDDGDQALVAEWSSDPSDSASPVASVDELDDGERVSDGDEYSEDESFYDASWSSGDEGTVDALPFYDEENADAEENIDGTEFTPDAENYQLVDEHEGVGVVTDDQL